MFVSRCAQAGLIPSLTEVQELLDRERRRGKAGIVLDLFGDGALQKRPAQAHGEERPAGGRARERGRAPEQPAEQPSGACGDSRTQTAQGAGEALAPVTTAQIAWLVRGGGMSLRSRLHEIASSHLKRSATDPPALPTPTASGNPTRPRRRLLWLLGPATTVSARLPDRRGLLTGHQAAGIPRPALPSLAHPPLSTAYRHYDNLNCAQAPKGISWNPGLQESPKRTCTSLAKGIGRRRESY